MKALLLVAVFVGVSCGQSPKRLSEFESGLKDHWKSLELRNSFAFEHKGLQYHFGSHLVKNGKHECHFFVGFRDGKFRYYFPARRLSELRKIHEAPNSIDKKMSAAVALLEQFRKQKFECNQLYSRKFQKSLLETTILYLGYSPLLVAGAMVSLVFWPEELYRSVKKSVVQGRLDDLKLGMTPGEVRNLALEDLSYKKDGEYELHKLEEVYESTDNSKPITARMIAIFKKGRLVVFLRGYGL